jgi:hypothetical protein
MSAPIELITQAGRRQVRRAAAAFAAVNLLLPLALLIYARTSQQSFWQLFRVEDGPSEWFSSVQCVAIALVAWANLALDRMLRSARTPGLAAHAWVWWVFAVGFLVAGLDERFGLHELLRDRVFRPAGLFQDLPWLSPGDVGLWLAFFGGLAFAALLLPELRRWPPALALFAAAAVLSLGVVMIDSLDDATLRQWPWWRFWDYPFEEIGELWAQLLFLLSFLSVLHGRLGQLVPARATP